ncbi:hypothetical protein AALA13_16570 [Lachnospiraceae bacterium 50-23]
MYRRKVKSGNRSRRLVKDDLLMIAAIMFGQALFVAWVVSRYFILFT